MLACHVPSTPAAHGGGTKHGLDGPGDALLGLGGSSLAPWCLSVPWEPWKEHRATHVGLLVPPELLLPSPSPSLSQSSERGTQQLAMGWACADALQHCMALVLVSAVGLVTFTTKLVLFPDDLFPSPMTPSTSAGAPADPWLCRVGGAGVSCH